MSGSEGLNDFALAVALARAGAREHADARTDAIRRGERDVTKVYAHSRAGNTSPSFDHLLESDLAAPLEVSMIPTDVHQARRRAEDLHAAVGPGTGVGFATELLSPALVAMPTSPQPGRTSRTPPLVSRPEPGVPQRYPVLDADSSDELLAPPPRAGRRRLSLSRDETMESGALPGPGFMWPEQPQHSHQHSHQQSHRPSSRHQTQSRHQPQYHNHQYQQPGFVSPEQLRDTAPRRAVAPAPRVPPSTSRATPPLYSPAVSQHEYIGGPSVPGSVVTRPHEQIAREQAARERARMASEDLERKLRREQEQAARARALAEMRDRAYARQLDRQLNNGHLADSSRSPAVASSDPSAVPAQSAVDQFLDHLLQTSDSDLMRMSSMSLSESSSLGGRSSGSGGGLPRSGAVATSRFQALTLTPSGSESNLSRSGSGLHLPRTLAEVEQGLARTGGAGSPMPVSPMGGGASHLMRQSQRMQQPPQQPQQQQHRWPPSPVSQSSSSADLLVRGGPANSRPVSLGATIAGATAPSRVTMHHALASPRSSASPWAPASPRAAAASPRGGGPNASSSTGIPLEPVLSSTEIGSGWRISQSSSTASLGNGGMTDTTTPGAAATRIHQQAPLPAINVAATSAAPAGAAAITRPFSHPPSPEAMVDPSRQMEIDEEDVGILSDDLRTRVHVGTLQMLFPDGRHPPRCMMCLGVLEFDSARALVLPRGCHGTGPGQHVFHPSCLFLSALSTSAGHDSGVISEECPVCAGHIEEPGLMQSTPALPTTGSPMPMQDQGTEQYHSQQEEEEEEEDFEHLTPPLFDQPYFNQSGFLADVDDAGGVDSAQSSSATGIDSSPMAFLRNSFRRFNGEM
ncbi:hypothetical protein H696_04859 [Fonticula alba]|uniref:Uncharacterized protein n=1 Tax=Fonticula alba TaxID=691883 RepID=A0A058Z377_FONAL|nr:hypothetical protein H696_04859 [Fonticula alba]KCV68566.1 hypothetical protein H696_04859 [Fonticula alba]|eukprot:XP_009496998.1 hypothetical protein H696_04859 [Fonticula alba]